MTTLRRNIALVCMAESRLLRRADIVQKCPQLLLICCEGKTEEQYFIILRDIFRIEGVNVEIVPNAGQHKPLVDVCATRKAELLEMGIFKCVDDIEVWAVCDRDKYSDSFTKLNNYSKNKSVNLAFSDPQFENYILQHFGDPNSSRSRGRIVEKEVTDAILGANLGAVYSKGNLGWLCNMIDRQPKLVQIAIRNSDNFSNHTRQPFFTVQRLTARLFELSSN
jgi:hypothetical protein